jgi:hypothetical protein
LDCGQLYDQDASGLLHTRIVMVPPSAKALLRTLGEAVRRHERDHGPIDET